MDFLGPPVTAMNCASVEVLNRIRKALEEAARAISPFVNGPVRVDFKSGDDPITEADCVANRVLRDVLMRNGEGWLSEESAEDLSRLNKTCVWVVDPIDGTREFVAGIPEWCISVGLVENGRAVAGGICNPATGEVFLGSTECGLTYNGRFTSCSQSKSLNAATVLASRSEVKRGEWERFRNGPFLLKPMGSVAYKLALVAAGVADATWTLCPKHEWDIAAGVALIKAAGGVAGTIDNGTLTFNSGSCLLPNLFAAGQHLAPKLSSFLKEYASMNGNGRKV